MDRSNPAHVSTRELHVAGGGGGGDGTNQLQLLSHGRKAYKNEKWYIFNGSLYYLSSDTIMSKKIGSTHTVPDQIFLQQALKELTW